MKNISKISNNNLSSVGTEQDISSSSNLIQEGGNFLSFLFGSDAGNYSSKLILDTFETKVVPVGLFVVKHALDNKVKLKLGKQDSSERTILHWMVIHSEKIPLAKELLFEVLYTPGASKYINKQDKYGNTVAHYAMQLKMNDVIGLLVKKGVDLTIENKEGLKIVLEEEYKRSEITIGEKVRKPQIFVKKPTRKMANSDFDSEAAQIARKIVDQFVTKTDDLESETLNFDRNAMISQLTDDKPPQQIHASDESLEVLYDIAKSFNKDTTLDSLMKNIQKSKEQTGGKKVMVGKRKLISNQELSMSGGDSSTSNGEKIKKHRRSPIDSSSSSSSVDPDTSMESDFGVFREKMVNNKKKELLTSDLSDFSLLRKNGDDSSEKTVSSDGGLLDELDDDEIEGLVKLHELERFQNPESTKRHDEAVKRIKDIMKVDDLTAKVYKSLLYKKIRDENKELDNDEMSKELEKQSSDEKKLKVFIKTLNDKEVKDLKKIIEEKQKEREKREKEGKKENKGNKDKKLSRFIDKLDQDSDIYTSDS